jgi:hypothetical protein
MDEEKHKGGRPPIFATTEELQLEVEKYFIYIDGEFHEEEVDVFDRKSKQTKKVKTVVWDRKPEPPTITGLVLFLGFVSRQSLLDYAKRGDEFSDIVKRAKCRVEHGYEKALWGDTPTGAIFALKQMGWSDKQEFSGPGGEKLFDGITDEQLNARIAELLGKTGT